MKKIIKYITGLIVGIMVLYNSVYFMPLDEKMASEEDLTFDPKSFVGDLWNPQMISSYDSAIEVSNLANILSEDIDLAFDKYGSSLGIGNIAYFKVKGTGSVLMVNENNLLMTVGDQIIELETEFIFGNAIRDASGLISINDFDRSSDMNSISEAINEKIRKEVIPDFRNQVAVGDRVRFTGAIELNKVHLKFDQPEVIPVTIEILR